jgi:hypothetical protein
MEPKTLPKIPELPFLFDTVSCRSLISIASCMQGGSPPAATRPGSPEVLAGYIERLLTMARVIQ